MTTAQGFTAERFHPRVETHLLVKVLVNGRAYLAQATDLSMAGCRLVDAPRINVARLALVIPLPDDREIVTRCDVRWRQDSTMAVEFDQLDWDDLLSLARYLHPRLP